MVILNEVCLILDIIMYKYKYQIYLETLYLSHYLNELFKYSICSIEIILYLLHEIQNWMMKFTFNQYFSIRNAILSIQYTVKSKNLNIFTNTIIESNNTQRYNSKYQIKIYEIRTHTFNICNITHTFWFDPIEKYILIKSTQLWNDIKLKTLTSTQSTSSNRTLKQA